MGAVGCYVRVQRCNHVCKISQVAVVMVPAMLPESGGGLKSVPSRCGDRLRYLNLFLLWHTELSRSCFGVLCWWPRP